METIRTYLDNMFAALPYTAQTQRLRDELYSSMLDKYNELKASGKSEHEAIGIVIAEFGNIEELAGELGAQIDGAPVGSADAQRYLPAIDQATADEFIAEKRASARLTSIGIILCILAPAMLIGMTQYLPENTSVIAGLSCLLGFVAVAVGLFIYAESRMRRFAFLEKGEFVLSLSTKGNLQARAARSQPTVSTAIGVILCILSPLLVIIPAVIAEAYVLLGVVGLLATVAISAGGFLCYPSMAFSAYKILLKQEEYAPQKRQGQKVIDVVAGIYWPLTVAVYLAWSFITSAWHFTWIVWPIAGICFGVIAGIISAVAGQRHEG
ncbi:MAG: permease prefix domain 1-containing protein [Christensenellales bacterium]|jgi:hypothetical protein